MTNILQKRLDKDIQKHNYKHVNRVLRSAKIVNHTMIHAGELLMIICVGWGSLLFANYNTTYESFHRQNITEANKYLLTAAKAGKPNNNNLISTWNIDDHISNTFAEGYCTYGAARISPEFFPYSGNTQLRTRGGNAIDRCENAAKAGFKIGSFPSIGSLVVYNPGNGISSLGHVGKTMFYDKNTNDIIVRDMNRLLKNTMTDHRDNLNTANIKCFIYPQKDNKTPIIEKPESIDNITRPILSGDGNSVITGNTTTTKPTINEVIESVQTPETQNGINIENNNANNQEEEEKEDIKEEKHNAPNQNNNLEIEKEIIKTDTTNTERNIDMKLDSISDIGKHFMDEYEFNIKKIGKDNINVGEKITLHISAKNKITNTYYNGILPFQLSIISSNKNISTNISRIQFLQGESTEIVIDGLHNGEATILLMIDDITIGRINISISN